MDHITAAARGAVLELLLQPEYGDDFLIENLRHEGVENITEDMVRNMDEEVMTLLEKLAKEVQ